MTDFLDSPSGKVAYVYNEMNDLDSIVLLTHGFKSDKNSRTCTALSEKLNKAGIPTLAFDLYGHGESEGDIENLTVSKAVDNALAVYDFAKKIGHKKIGLSGSSFSGIVSLVAASKRDIRVLSLKCPVFDYKKLWHDRLGHDGIRQWEENNFIEIFKTKVSYAAYKDASKYNMQKIASLIKAQTIVIHGDRDVTVPISQAQDLISLLQGEKKLVSIMGADHFFLLPEHFDKMIDESFKWFKTHL